LLPQGRLNPLWWIGIAGLLLAFDYFTGLYTLLPALYVVPVTLAAWYSGLAPAMALAALTPVAHIAFQLAQGTSEPLAPLVAAASLRAAVIGVMALWFDRLSKHERELARHVETLEGLLHICTFCKNIRNEAGEWERLGKAISARSDTTFSHGYCPDCITRHYPS
jgi:hypothetical protein